LQTIAEKLIEDNVYMLIIHSDHKYTRPELRFKKNNRIASFPFQQ